MTDSVEHAEKRDGAPRGHIGRFARRVVPRNSIDRVLRLLAHDDKPTTLEALFDGRAGYHTIRGWRKRGRAPQWAVDLLREKNAAHAAAIAGMKVSQPTANAPALGAWRAAQAAKR